MPTREITGVPRRSKSKPKKKPKPKPKKKPKPKPPPTIIVRPPQSGPGTLPLVELFQEQYTFDTVIDLGCGVGHLLPILGKRAKKIMGIDMIPEKDIVERPPPLVQFEYCRLRVDWRSRMEEEFDAIIACNIIEHVADTEQFIRWFFSAIHKDGAWCIIFPLPKDQLADGHVHIFNFGLMLYNIVRIGIDCSEVKMYNHGYACAIMGTKQTFDVPELANGTGDIAKLRRRFPFRAKHKCSAVAVPGLVMLRPDRPVYIQQTVARYYGYGEDE